MGMYDYVNVEVDCPKCGEKVRGFQSKDSECVLAKLDPQYVSNLYSSCHSCRTWVQFSRNEIPEHYEPRATPFSREEIEALGFKLCGV